MSDTSWVQALFHLGCQQGNVSLVRTLILEFKADLTARDYQNSTPLHVAALNGRKEVVLALIKEFGCDISVKSNFSMSLLHCACAGGNMSLVRTLICEYKANVTARDDRNLTPLHVAISNGKEEVMLALINEFGCDIGVKGTLGRSLLHIACAGGDVSLVRTLINVFKADLTARDDDNNTPLHVAALSGKKEVMSILIQEFGCDIGVKGLAGRSLLHIACEGGNVSLVRTLIHVFKANVTARDVEYSTPLHLAALSGKEEVVLALIKEFGCDISVKCHLGRSLLHCACRGGNMSLVRTLICEYKADVTARGGNNNTPLHVAALSGKKGVVLALINEFGCDISVKGWLGRSLLHLACEGGDVGFVRTLIHVFNADLAARDDEYSTPLHVAALTRKKHVVLALIKEFGCDISVKTCFGMSLLHCACAGGNMSLVRTLIYEYKADVTARDKRNYTPLHMAALNRKEEVVSALIKEFGCDISIKGYLGRSLLHFACSNGDMSLVRTLIHVFKADLTARDDENVTPLHMAAIFGREEVVLTLIKEFGCDISVKSNFGMSLLHHACQGGNASLVKTLICDYKADVTARSYSDLTPLHVASLSGNKKIVLVLIKELGCDINIKCYFGRSLLHVACVEGNMSLVRTLVYEYKAAITRDDQNSTPLHMAALNGREEIVFALIEEFGCDISVKGYSDSSLLHYACAGGDVGLVSTLIHKYQMPLLVLDDNCDTPLHICSKLGHVGCVCALLSANAPILVRNKYGKDPLEVATDHVRSVIITYMVNHYNELQSYYTDIQKHAETVYSGAHPIIRLLAIGHQGAGKSSFIESLKKEGFFESFWRITESSVPPHTAGIVPSVHSSTHYGRVQYYDFAGDPEYYSAHAAILENLSSSMNGDNIFTIVVNLMEEDVAITKALHYWFSFVQNQVYTIVKPKVIVIGSHLDQLSKEVIRDKRSLLIAFCESNKKHTRIEFFISDCCDPRASELLSIKKYLTGLTSKSQRYQLSLSSNILLGLLEKDFSHVIACPVETIVTHIKESGIYLPQNAAELSPILCELHETGLLLMIGDASKEDFQVVLNISKFTYKVHELLFSKNAVLKLKNSAILGSDPSSLNVGIIPESYFLAHFTLYNITKESLVHLQYCQEIKHSDCELFPSIPAQSDSPDQSLLFFPALCCESKSAASLSTHPNFTYSIGWLAQCQDPYDFFSPRFLHVLLLRIVFQFTLSVPQAESGSLRHLQRRCKMWKKGVHWLMQEGVECMVELVNGNKGVVVVTKSEEDRVSYCTAVFCRIVGCVMEAKNEFCHSINPHYFFLDSTDDANYLSRDNLFDLGEVQRVLVSPDSIACAISITGSKMLKRSRLECMHQLTLWHSLFPINFSSVIKYFEGIVKCIPELCLCLGLDLSFLHTLEENYPKDVKRRKIELVWKWMSSTSSPPCWWHLVEILMKMNKVAKANEIEEHYDIDVQLQKKLLDQENQECRPEIEFLKTLSEVIVSKRLPLTSIFSLTSRELVEMKEEEGLSQKEHTFLVMKKWVTREDATYGKLCTALQTTLLFN